MQDEDVVCDPQGFFSRKCQLFMLNTTILALQVTSIVAGKSTLLNIIGTIDKPSKGDVYVCGTSKCRAFCWSLDGQNSLE
jgi:ABC-type thiamine transport system ATPase subunit